MAPSYPMQFNDEVAVGMMRGLIATPGIVQTFDFAAGL